MSCTAFQRSRREKELEKAAVKETVAEVKQPKKTKKEGE